MAAIIHHGGMGTSARTLSAGVPQLVLAFGAERSDTAQRLTRLGVAEFLPLRPDDESFLWHMLYYAAYMQD
jgi:rhamnosyltransferase subunit B